MCCRVSVTGGGGLARGAVWFQSDPLFVFPPKRREVNGFASSGRLLQTEAILVTCFREIGGRRVKLSGARKHQRLYFVMVDDLDICEFLIPVFESIFCERISKHYSPELDSAENENSRIDYYMEFEESTLAIEHTSVGPYQDFERDSILSINLSSDIKKEMNFDIHDESIEVCLPILWESRVIGNRKLVKSIANHLNEFITSYRSINTDARYHNDNFIAQGLDVLVRYRKSKVAELGGLKVVMLVSNVEKLRLDRMEKHIPRKVEKLARWENRAKYKCLIIEDKDIQLSNYHNVANAIHPMLSFICNKIEFIIYIDSTLRGVLYVYPFMLFGNWDPEPIDVRGKDRYWEISV